MKQEPERRKELAIRTGARALSSKLYPLSPNLGNLENLDHFLDFSDLFDVSFFRLSGIAN